jgi:hydrogenase maturation factor HypF (carbamoyltransferase family)
MENLYLCPDCRTEHTDPQDAILGHIARCVSCALLLQILNDEQTLYAQILEVRLAA